MVLGSTLAGVLSVDLESAASISLPNSVAGTYAAYLKGIVDVCAAAVLLVLCLPLLTVVALLIVVDSHGSPLYKQKRVGKDGKIFVLYKFRTMCGGAERLGFTTQAQDARVTRVGSFLRETKIDEMLQLWNVLRGEMSLVGPRPLSVDETIHLTKVVGYSADTPGLIPMVRPGLTGLEQCTRSTLHPQDHRFWLNDYYQKNISLWLELWIIKRTLEVCPSLCVMAAASGLILSFVLLIWIAHSLQ